MICGRWQITDSKGYMIVDVACNIDEAYVSHCSVMLVSLFENNRDMSFCIHILSSSLSGEAVSQLRSLVVERYGNEISFHIIDPKVLSGVKECESKHISIAANIRLFLSTLLPETIDRVLYLDCDLIVVDSIKDIFEVTLDNFALAAVEDMWSGKDDIYSRLGYDSSYSYFNSGVMLVNLDYWRRNGVEGRLMQYYAENESSLVFVDQDLLNAVLYRSRVELPVRYNLQDGFYRRKRRCRACMSDNVDSAIANPAIIHFTAKRKPWNYKCTHPCRDLYFKYYKVAYNRDAKIRLTVSQWIDRMIYKLSSSLHLANGYIKIG